MLGATVGFLCLPTDTSAAMKLMIGGTAGYAVWHVNRNRDLKEEEAKKVASQTAWEQFISEISPQMTRVA